MITPITSSVFYGGLGYILWLSGGLYRPELVIAYLLLLAGFVFLRKPIPIAPSMVIYVLKFLVVFNLFLLVQKPFVLDLHSTSSLQLLQWMLGLILLMHLTGEALSFVKHSLRFQKALFILVTILLLVLRISVVFVSEPRIDVFQSLRIATQAILSGSNPYRQFYPDVYAGSLGSIPGFLYLPGSLLWLSPFQWLLGDHRYGLAAADFLAALAVGRLAHRHGFSGRLFFLLWFTFPPALLILNQSWIDTLLVLACLGVVTFWVEENFLLVGVCMGWLLSLKQYSLFVFVFTTVGIWLTTGLNRKFISYILALSLTFGAIVIPFLISAPHSFLYYTLIAPLMQASRFDALSVTALAKNVFGVVLPGGVYVSVVILTCLVMVVRFTVLFRKMPTLEHRIALWAESMVICSSVVFLLGPQAFCNYFQWVASFILISILFALPLTRAT